MKGFTFTIQCMITFFKLFESLQKHFSKSLKTEIGFITEAICQKNITLERRRFQQTKAYYLEKCKDS